MNKVEKVEDLREKGVINLIRSLLFEKNKKIPPLDDAFFYHLPFKQSTSSEQSLQFGCNSDMLVSSTDVPSQMEFFQIGRKAVIMNVSDLIVKGITPKFIIISLGLPRDMLITDLRALIEGIMCECEKLKIEYLGGDVNETLELIVNPTVFGSNKKGEIITRAGIKENDIVLINKKFGLNGVGFDIILKKEANHNLMEKYQKSTKSVLKPSDLGYEALYLSELKVANSSIDSSDGLLRSLMDLMQSNPGIGFELNLDKNLVEKEAFEYAKEYNVSIEDLVLKGGEEFSHIFTLNPERWDISLKKIQSKGGTLLKVGKVISEEKIYVIINGEKKEIRFGGFEHFKS